jgi:amino-acid N-acetyltransferase
MQVRPATPQDLDAIRRLLAASGLPTEDLTPSHLAHFFVAHEGSTLVGVVGAELYDGVALLRSLAVASARRGDGVGARLVARLEQYAHQEGARVLYLLTTTAAAYFARHGYRQVERAALPAAIQATDEAARLCPSSATCMHKRIDVASEESR